MIYLAIGGWVMAIFFLIAYLAAQFKLDDYRADSEVMRKLRARYPDDFKDLL